MPKGGKPKQQKKRAEKAAQQKSKKAEREERKRRRKDRDRYTDDEDKRFAAQLAAAGLRVNEVDADGNCLFRALSDQIEGSAKHHGKYRDEIVAFMRRDEERFKWFVEDDEDWGDYLARLGRDGEWGGNLELVAAANLRSVNVVVHQLEAPKFEICADDNSATRTVHLSYHGEAHYNSVRLKDDYSAEPSSGLPHIGSEAPRPASPEPEAPAEDRPPKPLKASKAPKGPCPCGSGKRYKKCCRAADLARARQKAQPPRDDVDDALAGEVGSLRI